MHGKWVTVAARVYYVVGLSYYLYHWLFILGVSGVAVGILTHALNRNYVTFGIAPMSISFLVWGIVLWSRKRAIQFLSHNPGLHEKLSETTYTILENDEYHLLRKLVVQSRHDGVDHYLSKFRWSGGLNVQADAASSLPHAASVYRQSHDIHMICRVEFERPLRQNEDLEFNYALIMQDTDRIAERFLSHGIFYRTDRLITRVRFTVFPPLRFYRRQIFASATADIPIFEETVNLKDHEEELMWEVKSPRIGYRYKLVW